MIDPLLDPSGIDALRASLAPFTPDAVADLLGPVGRSALDRDDLAGAARAVRGVDEPAAHLFRLFTLGMPIAEQDARRALGGAYEAASSGGLVERSGDAVRARVDVRPYAEAGADESWWVVCDLGAEVTGAGELPRDHVLGIGAASTTLAQAVVRAPVERALDVGTGCGVQALHLSRHVGTVTGTDISARALRMAATTAALAGYEWDLRLGSFTEPVAGDRFDLVVANPPFVVSSGDGGYDYRDSGLAGDGVSALLARELPRLLAPGGTAQLLANWIIPAEGSWRDRVAGWLAGAGCDAWVWQREVAELGAYVSLWLRDAGLRAGTTQWRRRYDEWLDWFAAHGVAAVGMGLITLWQRGRDTPDLVLEDVPQPIEAPAGPQIAAWRQRRDWLAETTDAALLRTRLGPAPDLVRTRSDLLAEAAAASGWQTRRETLRLSHGLRWEIEFDDAMARIVAACAAGATPLLALEVLVSSVGGTLEQAAPALVPVLRDLITRGFLLPERGAPSGPGAPSSTGAP